MAAVLSAPHALGLRLSKLTQTLEKVVYIEAVA